MEETADSGDFNISEAVDSIGSELFGKSEEEEVVEESTEEVSDTEEPEEPEEPLEEAAEQTREAPQSWKKEMREHFASLSPEVQDYIEQREEQMREGLEKDRTDASLGRTMRDVMSPYSDVLRQQGIDESVMVRNLLNAHFTLSTAEPAKRVELMRRLASEYGVSLDGEQKEVDPVIQSLQERISSFEQYLTAAQQRERQAAMSNVEKQINEFASKNDYFDEVSDDIIPFINAGYSLEDAYQKAIWANPVTRQKEIERQTQQALEKSQQKTKQEVEKARKAKVVNVRGRDTSRTPTEPLGTMEDTLRETLREIRNRSN